MSSFRDGTYAVTEEVNLTGHLQFAKLRHRMEPCWAGIVLIEANPNLPFDADIGSRPAGPAGPPGEGVEWGHGKVNAHQAVLAALNWVSGWGTPPPRQPHGRRLDGAAQPCPRSRVVPGNLSARSTYRLVDTRGRVWQEPAAPVFRIDLQGMPPGLYVVMAWDPEQQTSQTTRVVKTQRP